MAVSWFLLLCICVMVVILLAVNIYVLVHYSHPDDTNEAWLPKILVVSLPAARHTTLQRQGRAGLDATILFIDGLIQAPLDVMHNPYAPRSAQPMHRAREDGDDGHQNSHDPSCASDQILGLLLAESCILALPLDVANNANNAGCQQGWLSTCGMSLSTAVYTVAGGAWEGGAWMGEGGRSVQVSPVRAM